MMIQWSLYTVHDIGYFFSNFNDMEGEHVESRMEEFLKLLASASTKVSCFYSCCHQ